MRKNPRPFKKSRLIPLICIGLFVFASSPSYATYYSGHHYKPYYGQYGYSHHRPYVYKHHRHYGYPYHRSYYHSRHRHYGHYGVSSHFSGDAAYVVLGILGAAFLTHLFTSNKTEYRNTYPKTYSNTAPVKYKTPARKTTYHYNENEGWDWLAKGNADYALDIFAVQSQQDLNSGIPKVGFAIAAATRGEKERAIRAMRKAVRIDATALNLINIETIEPTIQKLTKNYQLNNINDTDTYFMIATLAYLNKDYVTANTLITENDQSQSANNLRELLKNKL